MRLHEKRKKEQQKRIKQDNFTINFLIKNKQAKVLKSVYLETVLCDLCAFFLGNLYGKKTRTTKVSSQSPRS